MQTNAVTDDLLWSSCWHFLQGHVFTSSEWTLL